MKFLCVLFAIVATVSAMTDKTMGTSGVVTINEGSTCPIDFKGAKNLLSVKNINKNEKALNLTIDFPEDVDDKSIVVFNVDKWTGNQWQKDFMKLTGPVCEKMNGLLPGLLKRISKVSKPSLGAKCPWKKGTYKITNLINVIDSKEMNIPTIPYGRFRFIFYIKDAKGKSYFCVNVESTITRK